MERNEVRTEKGKKKAIALVAHDNRKQDLADWARFNRAVLAIPSSSSGIPSRHTLTTPT